MNWMTSWPEPAEISDAIRVGIAGDLDVVDGDVDADLAAPVLRELVEPLVVARHEVAPHQDLEAAGELRVGLGELWRRRLAGRSSVVVSSSPPQPASSTAAAVAPWMNLRRVIMNGLNGSNSVVIASPFLHGPFPGPRGGKRL